MKLRIKDDSLRLRLQQGEIKTLAEKGALHDALHLGPTGASTFRYGIAASDAETVTLDYSENTVTLGVPRSQMLDWINTDRVGFDARVECGDHTVRVLVEKDFRCLVDRPNEDESDTFPNPNDGARC